ncbi:MAG TPA: M48 family metallopeptidase [Burkholderiaceae bacterium]|nr:M48 family metallopeptidase [Burkholderiaceae bacterium]
MIERLKSLFRLAAVAGLLAIAVPASAQQKQPPPADDGVKVTRPSRATAFASSEEIERAATTQYDLLKREAAAKRALAPADHPTVLRLRAIAERIIPFAPRFNERATQWKWEVNLLGSRQINAFCMPGGKIAFYNGIITQLNLTDDEIAMVMGHEIAHALMEHGRERLGKERVAKGLTMGASILSAILGYGDLGGQLAGGAAQLTLLKYSRDDETEADVVGLDLAARAGYDPRAAIVLWDKMSAASKGSPPQWLSTHPSNTSRTAEIRKHLKTTLPLYARAVGVPVEQLPPYATNSPPPAARR